jgi:AraC-like DNA-binding protein
MIQLICAFGALQLLLIAAAFSFAASRSRRLFGWLAAVLAVVIGGAAVMETSLLGAIPHLARVHVPFNFLIAPLFYAFTRAVLNAPPLRRPWLHLLPAIACAVSLAPFYALGATQKIAALATNDPGTSLRLVALLIQGAIYIAFAIRELIPHRHEQRPLWIAATTFAAFWAICTLRLTGAISPLVIPAGFSGCAALVIVGALRTHETRKVKYARSTLTDVATDRLLDRIVRCLEQEKPYLRGDLTLDAAAARLSLSSNQLSQIINQRLGRNFNDWINSYRVAEAQRLLRDKRFDHLSVAGVGDAAGFRAKSTYNAAFRKIAGMTPSEFRRRRPE